MLFLPAEHAEHPSPFPLGASMEAAARYAEPGEAYNLITSSGMAATQTIAHLHVHFVPRHSDDGLHLPWTGQRARMAAQARQDEAFAAGYLAREQSMSLHTLGMESSDQAERDQAFTRWQQERSNR
jgi:diadenosine tetraphosphate (Ap4A) HIT family hydrolase